MAPDSNDALGKPIWVDLGSPDVDASKNFYAKLFGWDAFTIPDPEAGGYTMFSKEGKQVAALGPLAMPEAPTAWSTYIGTGDADATAERVREAGGQVIVAPMDVLNAGRMGVFQDPTGAYISVWQPGEVKGIELRDAPGSLCWSELATRDLDGARKFYGTVFGWDATDMPANGGPPYVVFQQGDAMIAGAGDMSDMAPAEVPAHWQPYFAVDDCDAAVTTAQELGGKVLAPPMDIEYGRFAMLSDPQGAVFSVMRLSS